MLRPWLVLHGRETLWAVLSLFLMLEVYGACYICVLSLFMKFEKKCVVSSCVYLILLSSLRPQLLAHLGT